VKVSDSYGGGGALVHFARALDEELENVELWRRLDSRHSGDSGVSPAKQ